MLLLSPSFLVPRLTHDGVNIWDTMAIAEYLSELNPRRRTLPKDQYAAPAAARSRRDASGQQHRSALPMNIRRISRLQGLAWRTRPHIDRITANLARMSCGVRRPVRSAKSPPVWQMPCSRRCARAL